MSACKFVCLCARLSACKSVCVSACERVGTPGSMFVCMSTSERVCMPVRWFVCSLAGMCVCVCVCVSLFAPVRRVWAPVSLFVCPSVSCLFVCAK